MRQTIIHTLLPLKALRPLYLSIILLALAVGIVMMSSQQAQAEIPKSDPVLLYCQANVPAAARKACLNEENIQHARAAATYHCINHPIADNRKATCIQERAIIYFRDALKATPKPSSPAVFEKAFNKVLADDIRKTGGSITQGSPDAAAVTTSLDRTTINPGELPVVQADTTSIKSILSIVFAIIGAFAFLSIVACGLKYITSAGDPQKASEAKNGIIYSLLGLVIALTAQAIVAFVVKQT